MKIRKAIGVIVLNDVNEILLVHKVKIMDGKKENNIKIGEWDFPKGGLKKEESIEDAIKRELFEETNIQNYKIIQQLPDFEFEFSEELKTLLQFDKQVTYFFKVLHTGNNSDIHPDFEEIDKVEFFDIEEVINILHHESSKQYLKSLIANKYLTIK